VEDAVDYIFQELEKGSLIIVFPEKFREYYRLYREDRDEFDKLSRQIASERHENYRTKGTYY
jgi:hypothetical protein